MSDNNDHNDLWDSLSSYEFHTAGIDGVEVAGIVFNPSKGLFYEFQNPDDHEDYERVECPRTGEVMSWDSEIEKLMGEIMSGHIRAKIEASVWNEFREEYIESDELDFEEVQKKWIEMSHQDAREDGGVVKCNNCGDIDWEENPEIGKLGPTCSECGHPKNDPKVVGLVEGDEDE